MFLALLAAATVTAHTPAKPAPKAHKAPAAAHKSAPKPAPLPKFDPADPLALARFGMSQCYAPNFKAKTCASLVSFRDNGDGTLSNISTVLISSKPLAIIKTVTPVSVVDGAMCGQITREDITAGTLSINGSLYAADAATPILARIADGMTPLYGHQICTSYTDNGTDLTAHVALDGEAKPDQDNEVAWVADKDGFKVAP